MHVCVSMLLIINNSEYLKFFTALNGSLSSTIAIVGCSALKSFMCMLLLMLENIK